MKTNAKVIVHDKKNVYSYQEKSHSNNTAKKCQETSRVSQVYMILTTLCKRACSYITPSDFAHSEALGFLKLLL